MTKLELFLLGRPQFFVDGQEVIDFNTRKDRALLIYLAVTGTTHSRETLAGLLWSELPEVSARRNLRHALSHLQKVIGPQWLELERGVALTQAQPWSVDVHTLHSVVKGLTASQHATTAPSDPQVLATLQSVLQLYRGEFLQGFYLHQAVYFEEWVLAQREEARLLALRGLETWGTHCWTHGAYDAGLAATRRLLQLEPWSESAHCLQMQLLAHSGRRAEALAQYEICRQVLAVELGAAPLPTTTALYQQIQAARDHASTISQQIVSLISAIQVAPPANRVVASQPTAPNNLSLSLAGFVGRQPELTFIGQRLADAQCRLLTISGPGGMGKTSLAQAAAQRLLHAEQTIFPDGIFWVPLLDIGTVDPVRGEQTLADDPVVGEAILRAIAEQLGYKLEVGVATMVQLQAYLDSRRLLLILDNLEHLWAGTDTVVTLLTKAPQLKLLITSRACLNVRGETILPLQQLSLPTAAYQTAVEATQANPTYAIQDEVWQTSEAIAMFVQRAQQLDPAFTLSAKTIGPVGQICQLVEGLPLGIELATSMLPLLNCTALAAALTRSLDILATEMRDLPREQRTLGAVFERSWRLLPSEGQALLAKLAIFPGSFRREAAEAIVGATSALLRRLLDQSLLSKVGEDRYILHRTVHAFAQQKLQEWPEQSTTLQVQYAHFYLAFLADREPGVTRIELAATTEQIQAELDNVRTAWRWAATYLLTADLKRSADTLILFYDQLGFYLEAIELYEHALQIFLPRYEVQPHKVGTAVTWLVGRLQICSAVCYSRLARFAQALATYEAGWAIWQQEDNPTLAAICLGQWGVSLKGSNPPRSAELLAEAVRLAQASPAGWVRALISQAFGETIFLLGDYATAEAHISAGLTLAQQFNWPRALISGHKALGRVNLLRGRYREAEEHLRAGVALAQHYQFKLLGIESMIVLGEALRLQGRLAEAKACFGESRQITEALGLTAYRAFVFWEEGCLAEQCGEYEAAKALFTESLTAIDLTPWWSHALPTLGWALIGLGELAEAQAYFQKVWTEAETKARLPISLDAQIGLAYLTALRTSAAQPQVSDPSIPPAPIATVFQRVYQHPAATQETRTRIAKLAAALDVSLPMSV